MDASELKKIPILSHLSDPDLEKFAEMAEEREFATDAVIFEEGVEQDSLFIILSGSVLITKATHSGEEKAITTLPPGAFFGEMALFDDFVRSATAIAADAVRALEISKDTFMKYLSSDAEGASTLMLEIMRTVAPRIRQTNRELVALYEAGRIIGEPAELGEMLSNLLGVLSDATYCSRGAVMLLNTPAGMLECRAAFGYEDDPSGWIEPLEGGVAELVFTTDGSTRFENFHDDPRFESLQPIGYESRSMLCAALWARGEAVGMIVLCDRMDREGNARPFTSGDANLLAGVAAQAAGAIEGARLHEEVQEREKLDRVYFRY